VTLDKNSPAVFYDERVAKAHPPAIDLDFSPRLAAANDDRDRPRPELVQGGLGFFEIVSIMIDQCAIQIGENEYLFHSQIWDMVV